MPTAVDGLDKVESVPVVEVPMSQIHDWDTFHDTFAQTPGFPDSYGRNMDAWIDCLTYADEETTAPERYDQECCCTRLSRQRKRPFLRAELP